MNAYEIVKAIGSGSFGQVVLANHRTENKLYVIKKVKVQDLPEKDRANTEQEVLLLQNLRHPNIVAYKDSFLDKDNCLNIVMMYCEGGDLSQKLKESEGNHLSEEQVLTWFAQMALALYYLHENKILHRDLKPQNVFLKNGLVKLGDFGIAKVLDSTREFANTCIGTPYYMSPELLKYQPYKSDIWGLGCVLYEMCAHKRPFDAQSFQELATKIIKGSYPPIASAYSKPLRDLIGLTVFLIICNGCKGQMLNSNPKERPTIIEILDKPFVRRKVIGYMTEILESGQPEDIDEEYGLSLFKQAEKLGILSYIQDNMRKDTKQEIQIEGINKRLLKNWKNIYKNVKVTSIKLVHEEKKKEEELNQDSNTWNEKPEENSRVHKRNSSAERKRRISPSKVDEIKRSLGVDREKKEALELLELEQLENKPNEQIVNINKKSQPKPKDFNDYCIIVPFQGSAGNVHSHRPNQSPFIVKAHSEKKLVIGKKTPRENRDKEMFKEEITQEKAQDGLGLGLREIKSDKGECDSSKDLLFSKEKIRQNYENEEQKKNRNEGNSKEMELRKIMMQLPDAQKVSGPFQNITSSKASVPKLAFQYPPSKNFEAGVKATPMHNGINQRAYSSNEDMSGTNKMSMSPPSETDNYYPNKAKKDIKVGVTRVGSAASLKKNIYDLHRRTPKIQQDQSMNRDPSVEGKGKILEIAEESLMEMREKIDMYKHILRENTPDNPHQSSSKKLKHLFEYSEKDGPVEDCVITRTDTSSSPRAAQNRRAYPPQYYKLQDKIKLLKQKCEAGIGKYAFEEGYKFLMTKDAALTHEETRQTLLGMLGEKKIGFWHIINQIITFQKLSDQMIERS